MPTEPRREDLFIKSFLSAYEDDTWVDADVRWLDQELDGAVELHATRTSDGKTLAIEHTLLEPFVGDKADFAQFKKEFPRIAEDESLIVPGRWTCVFIPVRTLEGLRPPARAAVVNAVHRWLKANRLSLPDGYSQHHCPVPEMREDPTFKIVLTIKICRLGGDSKGSFQIGRQQVENDFCKVMKKALTRKLPKLVATKADKHILILERDHFNFFPEQILDEIESQRPAFLRYLSKVDEIWILETVFYQPGGHFQLDLYKNKRVTSGLQFDGERLTGRVIDGMPLPM